MELTLRFFIWEILIKEEMLILNFEMNNENVMKLFTRLPPCFIYILTLKT